MRPCTIVTTSMGTLVRSCINRAPASIAPNSNAAKGRRNAMSNKVNAAANAVAAGNIADAIDQLTSLLAKLDGEPKPKDWMVDSLEKDALRTDIEGLITLLGFLL